MSREAARGIFVVETSTADGKVGVIVGRRSALAVDAGIDGREGAELAEAVRGTGHAPEWLAFTHGHVDHVLGSTAFPGANVVATRAAADHIRDQVDEWAVRERTSPDDLASRLGFPTITFRDDLELDIGGRPVQLLTTPGHAPGAVSVYVPDAKTLFGGDTVVTGIPPTFKDGDSATLERTLRRLADLEVETLIPGHGPLVHGRAEVRAAILWAADYIARCRDHVVAHPVDDLAALVAAASYGRFIGDRLPADRHRMVWRHEQTMANLLAERARGALAPPT
jgi:glyoxylase-like metal-dependent hydrolase (beta-lactamase superfamily II)